MDLWKYPAGVTALLVRWTEKLAGGPQAECRYLEHIFILFYVCYFFQITHIKNTIQNN